MYNKWICLMPATRFKQVGRGASPVWNIPAKQVHWEQVTVRWHHHPRPRKVQSLTRRDGSRFNTRPNTWLSGGYHCMGPETLYEMKKFITRWWHSILTYHPNFLGMERFLSFSFFFFFCLICAQWQKMSTLLCQCYEWWYLKLMTIDS